MAGIKGRIGASNFLDESCHYLFVGWCLESHSVEDNMDCYH